MRAPILPSFHKGDEVRIEQLLVWAYREQMVHAARPEEGEPVDFIRNNYRPGWASGSNLGGMRVDEGGIRVAFTAHADAYSVDRAVSALGNVDRRRSTEEISIIVARRVLADVALARQRRARGDGTLVYEDRDCVELVRLPALVRAHAMAGTRPIPKLSEATHARALRRACGSRGVGTVRVLVPVRGSFSARNRIRAPSAWGVPSVGKRKCCNMLHSRCTKFRATRAPTSSVARSRQIGALRGPAFISEEPRSWQTIA